MKKYFAVIAAVCFIFGSVGIASAQDASATATVTDVQSQLDYTDNRINEAANLNDGRQFNNPASPQFGPVLNYFGQPLPSEGFQPVEQLIMYSCWFTDGSLASMLRGVEDAEAEFKVANNRISLASPAAEDGETKWIKVVISRDKYEGDDVAFRGFITARSDNKRTTMTEVMAKAAMVAMKNGCNVIHFTAQGAVRDVMSTGWGIGFNSTQAALIGGGNGSGNVTSGGTGYSSARVGTRDLPWLQGFGLVDNDLVYPALDLPAEKIDTNNAKLKPAPKTTAGSQTLYEVPQTSVRINPAS